ncbi:MAG: helix-turn-helix domain-containing protein [Deltaproteobacteria bacterium]|jgi:DNA-binding NtrC family response regulator|nr:helix-turn-helix domain-containing protein [Deltaproteobacteria bacterium]
MADETKEKAGGPAPKAKPGPARKRAPRVPDDKRSAAVENAMKKAEGVMSLAARELNVPLRILAFWLEKFGLRHMMKAVTLTPEKPESAPPAEAADTSAPAEADGASPADAASSSSSAADVAAAPHPPKSMVTPPFLDEMRRQEIAAAMKSTEGVVSHAATRLKVGRKTLTLWLKKYDLMHLCSKRRK